MINLLMPSSAYRIFYGTVTLACYIFNTDFDFPVRLSYIPYFISQCKTTPVTVFTLSLDPTLDIISLGRI